MKTNKYLSLSLIIISAIGCSSPKISRLQDSREQWKCGNIPWSGGFRPDKRSFGGRRAKRKKWTNNCVFRTL